MTQRAELELAKLARRGDSGALEELYQRYKEPLYRHARRMLRNEAAAQDVVQESFARAIDAIGRTREHLLFKAWIFRIATNLCLRQLNRRRRWIERDPADPGPDPESRHQRAELAQQAARALEQLPPRYRQILLLRELEELSYEELADVLDQNTGRIKVTLHRARARFAALFIAEQLSTTPRASVRCDDLRQLLAAGANQRRLVKHLETCTVCRKRDQRPVAEIMALLPPLSVPDLQPLAAMGKSAVTPGTSAAKIWITASALVATGVVVALVSIRDITSKAPSTELAKQQPQQQPRQQPRQQPLQQPPQQPQQQPRQQPQQQPQQQPRQQPRQQPLQQPLQQKRPPKSHQDALRIKLRFSKGTVTVVRANRSFSLEDPRQLQIGDTLRTHRSSQLGLRLPGHQWLVLQGRLRLDRIPQQGEPATRVQVTLHSGRVRARATSAGRGIAVAARDHVLQSDDSEYRVRHRGSHILVESLEGYVTVRGPRPRATRTLPPATGMKLGPVRSGFARRLLPAAGQLRPTNARGRKPPRLSWSPVSGARSYQVQIARDTDFMRMVRIRQVEGQSLLPTMLPRGTYYWQVIPANGEHLGQPSKIYSFIVSGGI